MKRRLAITALVLICVIGAGCTTKQQKEEQLKEILFGMRSAIDQFTLDHQRYPTSLQELVKAGYFRQIPADPMTGRNDTWKVAIGNDIPGEPPGISDIHSGSEKVGSDGRPYSSW